MGELETNLVSMLKLLGMIVNFIGLLPFVVIGFMYSYVKWGFLLGDKLLLTYY